PFFWMKVVLDRADPTLQSPTLGELGSPSWTKFCVLPVSFRIGKASADSSRLDELSVFPARSGVGAAPKKLGPRWQVIVRSHRAALARARSLSRRSYLMRRAWS